MNIVKIQILTKTKKNNNSKCSNTKFLVGPYKSDCLIAIFNSYLSLIREAIVTYNFLSLWPVSDPNNQNIIGNH